MASAGTVYPLVHNFIEDYYQYLDIMRQGFDGWWGATSRLTPEVYPRMFVSVFLLFLGHVARIFHVSLPVAYFAARVLGGGALMVLVYQLIRRTFTLHPSSGAEFPQSFFKRIIALCFVLFGTYFWGWGSSGPTVAPLTHAWTELDPIFRWSFVPHHLWSKVGMVAVFLLLLESRYTLSLILLTLLIGFANPVVYATMIPAFFLYSILGREIIRPAIIIMGAGFVLMYHRYLQLNIFPWTSYLLWEQTLRYNVHPLDYAMSLGPTLILFILAIPTLWRLGRIGKLYLSWAASSWIMLYIVGPFVPITPERFLGGYQFIPLGIGAAVWLFSHKRSHPASPSGRLFRLGVVVLLLCYFVVGLYASLRQHAGYVAANRNNIQVYIPNDLMASFDYLSKNSNPEEVVMAPYEISTMIPAFTGLRVIAGHAMFTKDPAVKKALINDFFAGKNPVLPRDTAWVLTPSSFLSPRSFPIMKTYTNAAYTIFKIQEK